MDPDQGELYIAKEGSGDSIIVYPKSTGHKDGDVIWFITKREKFEYPRPYTTIDEALK